MECSIMELAKLWVNEMSFISILSWTDMEAM